MTKLSRTQVCDRYENLYTGLVADVLDQMGFQDQYMQQDIRPINDTGPVAGIAFTAKGRKNRSVNYDEQIRKFLTMLGDVHTNSCVVIESNDDLSAQVGELTTTSLDEQNCRMLVSDGGIRDTQAVINQGFPVFVNYRTPADSIRRWELVDWDCEITVGRISIRPGDIIFADIDGVMVIPEKVAVDVLIEAEKMRDTEDLVREAIKSGKSPLEAYDKHGTF